MVVDRAFKKQAAVRENVIPSQTAAKDLCIAQLARVQTHHRIHKLMVITSVDKAFYSQMAQIMLTTQILVTAHRTVIQLIRAILL
jgi:hypothetical protein